MCYIVRKGLSTPPPLPAKPWFTLVEVMVLITVVVIALVVGFVPDTYVGLPGMDYYALQPERSDYTPTVGSTANW
ncbi:hypothetical protein DB346_11650 [Verrucomicrobia bacterium LW23]|nr:hypothetical protein DB346_11650 [Verrucomicrobia bacterium LW23]